mmetsp:Transcript_61994/g.202211  ORF Transcript_61994/g.202211 Transcript_61994/m.202211 type:complete len:317 (-) Transcript_61994:665-1615(-)
MRASHGLLLGGLANPLEVEAGRLEGHRPDEGRRARALGLAAAVADAAGVDAGPAARWRAERETTHATAATALEGGRQDATVDAGPSALSIYTVADNHDRRGRHAGHALFVLLQLLALQVRLHVVRHVLPLRVQLREADEGHLIVADADCEDLAAPRALEGLVDLDGAARVQELRGALQERRVGAPGIHWQKDIVAHLLVAGCEGASLQREFLGRAADVPGHEINVHALEHAHDRVLRLLGVPGDDLRARHEHNPATIFERDTSTTFLSGYWTRMLPANSRPTGPPPETTTVLAALMAAPTFKTSALRSAKEVPSAG